MTHRPFGAIALLTLACMVLASAPTPASAADLRVVIGDVAGAKVGRKQLIAFQRALKRLGGVEIQSTSDFKKQAGAMRVRDMIPQDAAALTDVCAVLEVDVALYGAIVQPDDRTWYDARPGDRVMLLSVYSGKDGRFVAEEIVQVPRGRLDNAVWRDAAQAIEPHLGEASVAGRPPEPDYTFDPVPVQPMPGGRNDLVPFEEDEPDEPVDSRYPLVQVRAGLAMLSRDFDYTAAPDSPLFAQGGVQYASSLVPGFAFDVEAFPLSRFVGGAAGGIGVGLTFEKVFLSTESTITGPDGEQTTTELETSHSHLAPRLLYRYLFEGGAEVGGHLGLGFLTFTIQDNPEYNGVDYTYFSLGIDGRVPLGSPLLAVELRGALLPWVGMGDTSVTELGADVSSSGWRLYGGIASQVEALTVSVGVEYTGISSEITGEGRGGRIGREATDRYVGARLMAGYRF